MRRRLVLFAVLCGPVLCGLPASAQDAPTTEQRRVLLTDGTVFIGTVVDEAADPLVVVTDNGVEQRIPRARVAEVAPLYAGRFTRLDPNRTRLFLAPTGRTLGRGAGRFSTYTFLPSVAFGVTDRLDLSGGASIPAVSSEGFAMAVNGNAKLQLARIGEGGGVALGTNVVVPLSSGEGVPGLAGTAYGVATIGSETSAFTVGAAGFYGTDFEDVAVGEGVALLVGYERQLSSSVKLLTEDYLFVGDGVEAGVLSAGVRFFGDRLAADLAVLALVTGEEFLVSPFPYVGFAYNFGR